MRDRTDCFLIYLDLVIIEWCVNWIYFPRVNNCCLCGVLLLLLQYYLP